ncbi:2-oxoglutarate and Fe(II)-dependent oxygenase superfamily protein, putative [Theobroma cacao]|uniref:2-oxoglutarate and Fe(II)-dependent oxygenase superfamily protein, putative n=1 Tax=Theobroma cacao TaxID=3641 RepID=A0A061FWB6_THECC|nr:2-oxoglutarate and Fe(II)-dependent oxygenase superfamily protein, putative [Theobroma cacao]
MADPRIPTVDLSPFFTEDDEDGKKKAMEVISKACSEHGFFQIVNHGVPMESLQRALELSRIFLEYPAEEKLKSSSASDAPLPAGYNTRPQHSPDKNEYLLMLPPGSSFNVFPDNPSEFKEVLEDVFSNLTKTGLLVESIVNQCLGLPLNFLKEFNNDRSWDLMDEAGGLQVCQDGEWIPVIPTEGTLVVNISDVIQVLSNNKFKSATHRVVRPKGRSRYSLAFFYNLQGDKWVEPLPQFTKDIGEAPKYRGFHYKEYLQLRVRNKTHPPARPGDEIRITHYKINT